MKHLLGLLTAELEAAFVKAGYDSQYAKVTLSNRPDLCEYQCNGAMAAAKAYRKAPFMIAKDVLAEGVFDDPVAQEYIVNSPQIIPIVYHVEILNGYSHSVNQRNREVCQYERVY